MNETISTFLVNGSIPLKVALSNTTNWTQYTTAIIVGLITSFGILILLYYPRMVGFFTTKVYLRSLSRMTKKSVVLIKHTEFGLFSQSMIDSDTLRKMSHVLNELNGKDFDLILHTPGGEIFSSLALSRMLKQYPGYIRAIVPLYSMSGGSLLVLSCNEIIMTKNASIGTIDPQLGSLFKFGSARAWKEIKNFKGKKAEDQTISFALMGEQYTRTIRNHLRSVVDFNLTKPQKDRFVNFLTDGMVEHAYPLTALELSKFGIKVDVIENKKIYDILVKIIGKSQKDGVFYYEHKAK